MDKMIRSAAKRFRANSSFIRIMALLISSIGAAAGIPPTIGLTFIEPDKSKKNTPAVRISGLKRTERDNPPYS
jgi:hypothetical protein